MKTFIATFPELKLLGKRVATLFHCDYTTIISSTFPDNESYVKFMLNPKDKTVVMIVSFAQEPNKKLIECMLAADAAREYGAKKVILVATYLPYMRQDTHFENYDAASAYTIVKMLAIHFDKIVAIDPHLHRISSLREIAKNAREITTSKLIAAYIQSQYKDSFHIVGPDKESFHWARAVAALLGRKAIILRKVRHSSARVTIQGKPLGENVIIIDDIISTGHTILETIKIAKQYHAKKITCIGVHGIFANHSDKMIEQHATIVTTNTIPNRYARIDVAPLIVSELERLL